MISKYPNVNNAIDPERRYKEVGMSSMDEARRLVC